MQYRGWTRRLWIAMAVVCAALIPLWGCRDLNNREINRSDENPSKKDTGISVHISIKDDEEVLLVSPVVKEFFESDIDVHSYKLYAGFANGKLDYSVPLSVSYYVEGIPEGMSVSQAVLYIDENENSSDQQVYTYEPGQTSLSVNFLKTNTIYFYKIEVTFSDGSTDVKTGSFRTANTPRILSIDGIVNVRDIGGWETKQGTFIRQGMIYRGSELDGAVVSNFRLTAAGTRDMLDVLKIKTDMDLRHAGNFNGTHALGADVKHIYYGSPGYGQIFEDNYQEAVRNIFADLADSENYPIYLHCTYGNDRTGTICYLLEALLGVSDENLLKEYALSIAHYGDKSFSMKSINDLEAQIQQRYPGKSTQEKVKKYLLSVGVTETEIQSIRDILLSDENG